MGRKTKKEKIIASLRRKIRSQTLTSPSQPPSPSSSSSFSSTKEKSLSETPNIIQLTPIKNDLKRTFFFSLVAIVAELVIYWRWR